MADVETKETKVAGTPEKKVVDEEKTEVAAKETPTKGKVPEAKETPTKGVKAPEAEVDEDSKASENGEAKKAKENGSAEEKEVDEKEPESHNGKESATGETNGKTATTGDATDATTETCCIKRKSTGGNATDDAISMAASPKKAKLDTDNSPVEVESNGS